MGETSEDVSPSLSSFVDWLVRGTNSLLQEYVVIGVVLPLSYSEVVGIKVAASSVVGFLEGDGVLVSSYSVVVSEGNVVTSSVLVTLGNGRGVVLIT